VDDDPDILLAVGALIERWGAVVTRSANLAEVPAGGHWDAAVADYQLPDGNGLDLLRDLAGRCPLRILVTATPVETGHRTCLPRASACWPSLLRRWHCRRCWRSRPSPVGRLEPPGCAFHRPRSVPRECKQLCAGLHPSLRRCR
jgi:hypothetical protein